MGTSTQDRGMHCPKSVPSGLGSGSWEVLGGRREVEAEVRPCQGSGHSCSSLAGWAVAEMLPAVLPWHSSCSLPILCLVGTDVDKA